MKSPEFVLAIDQGTSSSRAILVDRLGRIVASASRPLRSHYPKPGWVEQNPDQIWKGVSECIQELMAARALRRGRIAAIGITNQRETTILWERGTGRALGPAIVWQCRRSADICKRLKEKWGGDFFHRRTGLVLDPYFSATKILWRFGEDPGLRARAARGEILFGTVDSWLLWKLSGGKTHATDFTNASRTLLFSIQAARWDEEILAALKIPARMLPQAHPSIHPFGTSARVGALPSGIPMAGVAGDQQAALFAQGCHRPGMVKNTYGTGCFILWALGEKLVLSRHGLVTTWACFGKDRMGYALEGSVFIAGAAIQWLRDELGLFSKASDSEALARRLKENDGVYFVPAFTGLGAPFWASHARGAIFGLTRGTGKEHLVRAALEAIAYQTRDVLEAMAKEIHAPLKELRADGGASQNDFLMQFQADLLHVPVDRPQVIETTALGAAFLAGLGVGFWKDENEICALRKTERRFRPRMRASEREGLYRGWEKAVRKCIKNSA